MWKQRQAIVEAALDGLLVDDVTHTVLEYAKERFHPRRAGPTPSLILSATQLERCVRDMVDNAEYCLHAAWQQGDTEAMVFLITTIQAVPIEAQSRDVLRDLTEAEFERLWPDIHQHWEQSHKLISCQFR